MLESGNLTAAAVLLSSGKFRADDAEHWLCLDLLYLLRSRKFDQFYTGWGELRKKGWKNPAPVLYLLAADGARLALEMKQPEAAAGCGRTRSIWRIRTRSGRTRCAS